MGRKKIWTEAEEDFIKNCPKSMSDTEIWLIMTKIVNRKITLNAIANKRRKLLKQP